VPIGSLAQQAAATNNRAVATTLKPQSELTLVGTPQQRIDATDIVTGRKRPPVIGAARWRSAPHRPSRSTANTKLRIRQAIEPAAAKMEGLSSPPRH
jgi:hypothetical protein